MTSLIEISGQFSSLLCEGLLAVLDLSFSFCFCSNFCFCFCLCCDKTDDSAEDYDENEMKEKSSG